VDAFAFSNGEQHEIFTLQSGDFAYRVMVENINEGALNLSEDKLVVYTNRGFYHMLQLTYDQVIGSPITDFIQPGSLSLFYKLFADASNGQSRGEINLQAGGKTIPVYISLTSLQPNLPTVGMIVTDLSEKKQNEKDFEIQKERERKINESQKELQELANAVPQLVWIADAQGNMIYFNDRIAEFTPGAKSETGEWNWENLLHPEDLETTKDAWINALSENGIYEKEHRLQLKDGSYKWYLSRGYPQVSEKGETIKWYGTATDIHAQKIHETQKDEFLKMVSHELKTPVTSIKGYVQLLLAMLSHEDNAVAQLVKQPLQRIDSQVVRLGKLITGILDIARLEDGRMDLVKEKFRLDELLKETIQDMMFAHSTHTITVQNSFDCWVYADKNRMGQVIINLITNAIKYSPENNKIEINLTAPAPGYASVSIRDFGVGIEQSEHHKIFQRFYQTGTHENQNYTGFGIGLYITAEIIHRHQGEISVTSTPGKGSVFTFTIPVTTKNKTHEL
jgi:two-component system, OmpR family, phosphate regulon sensor histidine kinase PhoR